MRGVGQAERMGMQQLDRLGLMPSIPAQAREWQSLHKDFPNRWEREAIRHMIQELDTIPVTQEQLGKLQHGDCMGCTGDVHKFKLGKFIKN